MKVLVLTSKNRSPISRRLKEARIEAGLSQKSLGVMAGIDQFSASARMNQYETDTHVPDYGTVKRIAGVLTVPPAFFYCEDDRLAKIISAWPSTTKKKQMELLAKLIK